MDQNTLRFGIRGLLLATAAISCGTAGEYEEYSADQASLSSGQVILDWNQIALAQGGNPLRISYRIALVHAAQHDAVNAANPRYESFAFNGRDRAASPEAAAITAAHGVLVALHPSNQASLDASRDSALAGIPDGNMKTRGIALGEAAAQAVLAERANDGSNDTVVYNPTPAPGVWEPTPPAFAPMLEPQWAFVDPFALRSPDEFRGRATDLLDITSSRYAAQFNEVKSVGRDTSTTRTADQTHYGLFWLEASPVTWSRVGRIFAAAEGLDLHDTARLFAHLGFSQIDGFISGFEAKEYYSFWRPVTAIWKADTDGNAATDQDTSWLPLRPTPPIPEYPSTHSILGAAAAEVLAEHNDGDAFSWCMTTGSASPAGSTRCFSSFSQASQENQDSRVVVGYHYRDACTVGGEQGESVGEKIYDKTLRPL